MPVFSSKVCKGLIAYLYSHIIKFFLFDVIAM